MGRILVTGGYGYIGAHVIEALANAGYRVDSLDCSIGNNDISDYIGVHHIVDIATLNTKLKYNCVVHLAAAISVADSVQHPSHYYNTNIVGTLNLLKYVATDHFIFASTGAVIDPKSPYALSKLACEDIIRELCNSYTILRFFNVAGSNGTFKQRGQPTHLITLAAMAAQSKISHLPIYGNDYATRDGTCIRDYVHVEDIAKIIVDKVRRGPSTYKYENIGSGVGYSNLEVVNVMKKISNNDFKIIFEPRRQGDAPILLGEILEENKTTISIENICLSTYNSIAG